MTRYLLCFILLCGYSFGGCSFDLSALGPRDGGTSDTEIVDAPSPEDVPDASDSGTIDASLEDTGVDAWVEDQDAGTDAGSDAGVDAGSDTGTDAGSDAGSTDAGSDSGPAPVPCTDLPDFLMFTGGNVSPVTCSTWARADTYPLQISRLTSDPSGCLYETYNSLTSSDCRWNGVQFVCNNVRWTECVGGLGCQSYYAGVTLRPVSGSGLQVTWIGSTSSPPTASCTYFIPMGP